MLQRVLLSFAAGSIGGMANVIFLVITGLIGLPLLMGLDLPSFAKAGFLYKQAYWGGLWALVFLLPFMPKNWIVRGVIVAIAAALVTLFVFFPMGKAGVAGLNIGVLMPMYVLLADLTFGLVASKLYALTDSK